jgi:VanZ family protein
MMVLFKSIVVRWKLFYLYIFFLVLLSVLPINGAGSSMNHIFVVSIRLDYFLHCLVYVPLVVFTWMDKEIDTIRTPFKALGWIMILLLFAAVTEWIQYFLPYRAFNINDLISNCLGIIIGLIIIFSLKHFIAAKLINNW